MKRATSCIEALESRELFSASLGGEVPTGEPAVGGPTVVYVGGSRTGFATEPNTAEAKEQFTRYKPHVSVRFS